MEVSEIENYKLTSAFTLIGSNTSMYNLYAVIIRTGVHIIEIMPNLTTAEKDVTVRRSMIKTPKDFPLADVDIDLRKLNREEFCLLHLDYKLYPHFDKMAASDVYTKQISWIKVQDADKNLPVLGVLSNRGALQLFAKSSFSWKKVADISSLWKDFCSNKWFPSSTKDDYVNVERKFKCVHISAFACCEGFSYRNDLPLVATISESGIIALWCIPTNLDEESPHIITTAETHLSVQYLYWHKLTDKKGWLILACHDGLLKLYSCEPSSKDSVSLKFEYEVWKYADLMAISNLKVKRQDSKSIMVFSKENSVLVFSLSEEKILGENFYEFERKVSGIEILDNTRIFVTLFNCQSYEVHIEKPESATRECVPVNFNTTTNLSNYNCYGVSFSKNKLWCLLYLKMNVHYDHLLIKEPHCVMLGVLNQKQEIITPSTVEALIKQNLFIYDVYDYIEYFRIRLVKEDKIDPSNDIQITWDYLNGDIEICRKFFQLAYILMKCYSLSYPQYYAKNKDQITSVEIIFMVCNFLFYQEKITAIRKQYFFYKWLAANITKLPPFVLEYQRFKKVSDMMNNFTDVCFEEKCDLCTSNVSDYGNLKYVICEKGHKLLRCSFSFLPISAQPTKECNLCHSIVHQSEDTNRCIICDNIF